MKNVFILLAISLIAFFSSCEKCGTCTTTTVTSVNPPMDGYPQTSTTTQTGICGDDFKKLDGNEVTSSSTMGDYTVTSTSTTRCVED